MIRSLPRLPESVAYPVAAIAFLLVFASAGTPIPLYHLFRVQDGLGDSDFAFASVGYFAAAVTSLLLLGRLSNHLGRRPVAIAALLAAAAGTVMLLFVHSLPLLVIARVLQGIAAGVAPSGIGAYVFDTAHRGPRWLPAVIAASTPMLGIPLGAIFSGAVIDYGPAPRQLIVGVMAAALMVAASLIVCCPETMRPRPGLVGSLRPRLHVPHGAGRVLTATGAAAVATWSLGGFFQAFGPSVTATYLGTDDALVAAVVFSAVMILNPLGGPIAARLRAVVGVRVSMAVFIVALAGIIASLYAGAIGPFLGFSLVVGVTQGIASTSATRALTGGLAQHERAGLLATVYLISYTGAAIPGLIAGQLARTVPLATIAAGYAILGTLAALTAMIAIRIRPDTATEPAHP